MHDMQFQPLQITPCEQLTDLKPLIQSDCNRTGEVSIWQRVLICALSVEVCTECTFGVLYVVIVLSAVYLQIK